ncbi:MAG TPA: corrinoid protein [Clostridia bacterium]|nr:corrinoid protein [Clostridia bacterium]
MSKIDEVFSAVETGKAKIIAELVQSAIDAGEDPMEILNRGMVSAMSVIGERFSRGEAFVPEMLISARTMKKGVEVLKPYLAKDAVNSLGTAIIGTVQGDMHDIGKNLVAMMIESAGFEVVDLEVDVPLEQFVEAIAAHPNVRIVALSTLLTTTMPAMKQIVAGLNALENRDSFRIMVGGAPITEEFARQIGADGYSPDAAAAAALAKSLAS